MLQGAECLVEMVDADASGGNRSHAAGRPAATLGAEKPAEVHMRGRRLRIPGMRERVEVRASVCSSMGKSLNLVYTSSSTYWLSAT